MHMKWILTVAIVAATLAVPVAADFGTFYTGKPAGPALSGLFPEDVRQVGAMQLVDDAGPPSSDRQFGAGVALGVAGDPVGLGITGWFDYYFTQWIAAGGRFQFAYGVISRPYEDGGIGLEAGLQVGAKFVFDMEHWEWSRWCRPFAAFYPLGFRHQAGTEDFDPPGTDNNAEYRYSDTFYVMTWGGGVDFFLTNEIGIGVGLYVDNTFGGSRHRSRDVTLRTRGRSEIYFEYIRLAVRF